MRGAPRVNGSPAAAVGVGSRPPLSPSVAQASGEGEPAVPAALAALLHQSDRSGRQQFTHSPYGSGANPNSPRTGAGSVPPSPLNTSAVSLSTAGGAGGAGVPSSLSRGGGAGAQPAASSPVARGSSTASFAASQAAREEKKSWRLLTALTCCMGLGPASPASSSPPPQLQACNSNSPGSPGQEDAASETSTSSTGSEPAGSGAAAGGAAPLTLPHTPAAARRPQASLDSGGASTPSGGFTPSQVLSPKNHQAAKRAQRQLAARASYDASASDMSPWGSRHPTLTRAGSASGGGGGTPNLLSRLSASRSGHAGPSGAVMSQTAPSPAPHPHANMGPVTSPATPRQVAALEFCNAQLGSTPADSPAALEALGMLNTFGNPKPRINNVRRGASAAGEGPLLAHLMQIDKGRPCLVLDLDETLVHSSFKPVPNADYVLPVEIEGVVYQVYVIKRPGCDEFLARMGKLYEVVIFTASLAKYADPLLDLLDPENVMRARLFREACVFHEGNFVKDLSLIGRDPKATIIVDNSPASFLFQPENAILCDTFIDNKEDRELWALADFLTALSQTEDVREGLSMWAAGTYRGPQSLKRRVAQLPDSEAEDA